MEHWRTEVSEDDQDWEERNRAHEDQARTRRSMVVWPQDL
jgi:hypothetical protein